MIIPIGVDCEIANFLKKYGLRNAAFPFDWVVSYNGVYKCIENNFESFVDPLINKINEHDIYFHHDFDNDEKHDKQKYMRRCKRLIDILETSNEEIIFCRKGHACHHHEEHDGKYSEINNDINDAENLDLVISSKYPNLNYKIIVILICRKCFNPTEVYESNSNKISIYNIANPFADDDIFENCARKIFKV